MSNKKREYVSEARQANAELTKQRILSAAKQLFSTKGFEKTTIGNIAELAKVSAPSIYALYKSKEGVLQSLLHSISFGANVQTLIKKVVENTDSVECLKTVASIARNVYAAEKGEMEFFRGAAVVSPALKAFEKDVERQRYKGQELVVRRLFEENAVLPEINFADARDILWSLTSREMYRMLVVERKWSLKKYESWLADTLTRLLIKADVIASHKETK